jgi:ribosomal protein S18 acetylase RimI-like enzyme
VDFGEQPNRSIETLLLELNANMSWDETQTDVQGPFVKKSALCASILAALPEWFGIEEANRQYIRDIEQLPTLLASVEGETVGFLTLKEHNEYAAELHVMGVKPEMHRRGVGRALVHKAESHLRERRFEYLQVKTLSDAHPDRNYARTRAFYLSMGFRPLEEFPELWGPANPCLQLIKRL